MRIAKLVLVSLLAIAVPGVVLDGSPPSPVVSPAVSPAQADFVAADLSTAPPLNICIATAIRVWKAAQHEARDDFQLAVGRCLNASGDLEDCIDEAEDALDDALDEVEDQYDARVAACGLLGPGAYDPQINPAHFSPNVTNLYHPLIPGVTRVYEKMTPEGLEHVEVATLDETAEIGGVTCRVVKDTVTIGGDLIEDTIDWFAQHTNGSVWYVGEISRNFEDGMLDNLDGSWRKDKDGAKPGIIMLPAPVPNAVYRQEFDLNNAEDLAKVISLGNTVTVPFGTFINCLQTEEWSPLEPGHTERKFYAPGVGLVKVLDVQTGEVLQLVQIIVN